MAHSPARSAIDVGTLVGGTYHVDRLIGRGGMGAVFAASHTRLPGKHVAIKVLHPDVADPESLARFRREAEIATRLGHPNIVEVHDFNELADGTPYLILELLQGESLSQRMAAGPLRLAETLTIVRQVGSALAAAHREDIIHRDLKPQNVFLVATEIDGVVHERAKVLDFGISKIRGSQTVKTQDSAILGTPQYMAPEQAIGNHAAVDARTDVFALGAMVYEMLCGEPAFTGQSIPEVVFKVVYEEPPPLAPRVPSLPPHVPAAIHRALAKKSDDRFPDVSSFIEALTGAPLTVSRRQPAIGPGDAATPSMSTGALAGNTPKITSGEALASTIGSGDHARAVGNAATIGSGDHQRGAIAVANTMATGNVATAIPDSGTSMPIQPLPTTTTPPTIHPPAPSRTPLILGVVGVLAIAAVAITFLVTSKRAAEPTGDRRDRVAEHNPEHESRHEPGRPTPPAGKPEQPTVVPPPVEPPPVVPTPTVVDAGAGTSTGTGTGAKPVEPKHTRPTPPTPPSPPEPPPSGGDDAEDPAALKVVLGSAEDALKDGDTDKARKLAAKVLNDDPRNVHAFAIKARAFCADQDKERAMTALRQVGRHPSVKARVIAYCKGQGVDL